MPSPPRNCLPRFSVVWVACAVACSEALATASGSPGAPALIWAGRVGSHSPGSASAAGVGATENISPVTIAVIQAKTMRRNRLRRMAPRSLLTCSPLDVTDHVGRHAAGADGGDADLQPDIGRLEHLAVAEVDGDVLGAARSVEDDVAAAHLRGRDLAAQVVLRARVVRQLDAHPGERIQHQPRTVEADDVGAGVDALAGAGRVAAAPGVGHPDLRHAATDHVLRRLPPVHPRDARPDPAGRRVGDAGVVGLEDAELLQEVAAETGGDLGRGGRDAQHLVDHRDRVAGKLGARDHRQGGVPGAVPLPARGRRRRARRSRLPAVARARGGQLTFGRLQLGLGLVPLGGQPDHLLALLVELLPGVGQRGHRGVLAGLGVGGGLVAFCSASRAADSLLTCSVRACCSLAITVCELAVRLLAAASVAMMSSGLRAVR
uniref:MAV432 n=1 Tax=Mycobacterium avium TaxID=1764 RepID=O07389_MYCAV|nr:MAV432 [Mycobacterium avium]